MVPKTTQKRLLGYAVQDQENSNLKSNFFEVISGKFWGFTVYSKFSLLLDLKELMSSKNGLGNIYRSRLSFLKTTKNSTTPSKIQSRKDFF
jgi:hypothetical protein